ncbi:MAG TPA: hypothetical protein VF942_16175 [Acidimicrobiales bacterium]
MLGDRVEVLIDVGGSVRSFDIEATRAGRRVEISSGRGVVEVVETTRSGQPVRTARFMSARIVAIVEHPASGRDGARDGKRRGRSRNQPALFVPEAPPEN